MIPNAFIVGLEQNKKLNYLEVERVSDIMDNISDSGDIHQAETEFETKTETESNAESSAETEMDTTSLIGLSGVALVAGNLQTQTHNHSQIQKIIQTESKAKIKTNNSSDIERPIIRIKLIPEKIQKQIDEFQTMNLKKIRLK